MRIELRNLLGSPYVGIFCVVTERVALFPLRHMAQKELHRVEELLGVEVVRTNLANSALLGSLAIGNSQGFVVSDIVEEHEIDSLQKSGLMVKRIPSISAIGNLVEINDAKALCSAVLPEAIRDEIGKFLRVEIKTACIAGSDLIGANLVATNRGFIINPNASAKEFSMVEKYFGLQGTTATANYGDVFIGNDVAANTNAAIVGSYTTGFELSRIDEGLHGGVWE